MYYVYGTRRRCRGFTALEILIAVVIIGLLAAIAIPAYKNVREKSRVSATANDFRVMSQAFLAYFMANGDYPVSSLNGGDLPAGMNEFLKGKQWDAEAPIGGEYFWNYNNAGLTGVQLVNLPGHTQDQLEQLDDLLDDGSLADGNFQEVAVGEVIYVVDDFTP